MHFWRNLSFYTYIDLFGVNSCSIQNVSVLVSFNLFPLCSVHLVLCLTLQCNDLTEIVTSLGRKWLI